MSYLVDFTELSLFHPGVKQKEFMTPLGGIIQCLEKKEVKPFITPFSRVSGAAFLFQAFPCRVFPCFYVPIHKQIARPDSTSSNDAGSPSGAGAPQPASSQQARSFSRQHGHRIPGGDVPVNKPVNLREGLRALPRTGQREIEILGAVPAPHMETCHE